MAPPRTTLYSPITRGISKQATVTIMLLVSLCFLFTKVQGAVERNDVELIQQRPDLLHAISVGNKTLPDPDLINAYFRSNTTLRNFLLPSNPPLELIKCEVSILQLGIVTDFYVADHPMGCEKAPPMAVWPESQYSKADRSWYFQARRWLCSWRFAFLLLTVNSVLAPLIWYLYYQSPEEDPSEAWGPNGYLGPFLGGSAIFPPVVICTLVAPFMFTMDWMNTGLVHPLELPDPATGINPLLHSSNISLSLQLCRVPQIGGTPGKDYLFDFYTGMTRSMCSQLLATGAIFGDYLGPSDAYGGREQQESRLALYRYFPTSATLCALCTLACYIVCLLFVIGKTSWEKYQEHCKLRQKLESV